MLAPGLGETRGVVGIKLLLLLLMNLPLESLSLHISLFLGVKKQDYLVTLLQQWHQNVCAQPSVPKLSSLIVNQGW